MMIRAPQPPLHCRLHLWHHWKTFHTDDGNRYMACAQCKRERPPTWIDKNTIGA